MNLAVVGATGMVGRTMLQVLEERGVEASNLYLVASEKSKGTKVRYRNQEFETITLNEAIEKDLDYALFSAGGGLSLYLFQALRQCQNINAAMAASP